MDEGQLVWHRRAGSRLPGEVDVVHVSRDYLSNKESLIRLGKHAGVCIYNTTAIKVILSRTPRIELDDNWRSGGSNHSVININSKVQTFPLSLSIFMARGLSFNAAAMTKLVEL